MRRTHASSDEGSRGSGYKGYIGAVAATVSFPMIVMLAFSFQAPGRFTVNLARMDYWDVAVLLGIVTVVGDLVVKFGPVGKTWEQRQVRKGLPWTPTQVNHRADFPHES